MDNRNPKSILDFPIELLREIGALSTVKVLSSLSSSCRLFRKVFSPQQLAQKCLLKQITANKTQTYFLLNNGEVLVYENNKLSLISDLKNIQKIITGNTHTFFMETKDKIWVWGSNKCGQFGMDPKTLPSADKPIRVHSLQNIDMLAVGSTHTLALTLEGKILGCGNNFSGEVGLGDVTTQKSFTEIPNLPLTKQIFAGNHYSVALAKDTEEIFVFGYNYYGQFGLGDRLNRKTAKRLPLKQIQDVFTGPEHIFFLKHTHGTVLTCGENYADQLGIGCPITVAQTPGLIQSLSNIVKIITSDRCTVFIKKEGQIKDFFSLWICGANELGQLGLGHTKFCDFPTLLCYASDIKDIVMGHDQIYVLRNDQRLFTLNHYLEIQKGKPQSNPTPPMAFFNRWASILERSTQVNPDNNNVTAPKLGL